MASRTELPDKIYFKIGEVADLLEVKQHVLRYWESEFPSVRPQKSKNNQRLYKRKDVETLIAIKHLLYEQKYTIEGARRHLKENSVSSALPPLDPQSVATAAKMEAIEEMRMEVKHARAETADSYDAKLLGLKEALLAFVREIDSMD